MEESFVEEISLRREEFDPLFHNDLFCLPETMGFREI